jgi:transcriptional regulator CtsR
MGISDLIAGFILNAMREADGVAELQRNELAQRFNCVPSQINYVVSTRFSPEHGYIVESRRGGGGYIRISRVPYDSDALGMHAVNSIGESVSASTARAILSNLLEAGILQERDLRLVCAATGEQALRAVPAELKDTLRAAILKQLLVQMI